LLDHVRDTPELEMTFYPKQEDNFVMNNGGPTVLESGQCEKTIEGFARELGVAFRKGELSLSDELINKFRISSMVERRATDDFSDVIFGVLFLTGVVSKEWITCPQSKCNTEALDAQRILPYLVGMAAIQDGITTRDLSWYTTINNDYKTRPCSKDTVFDHRFRFYCQGSVFKIFDYDSLTFLAKHHGMKLEYLNYVVSHCFDAMHVNLGNIKGNNVKVIISLLQASHRVPPRVALPAIPSAHSRADAVTSWRTSSCA
jgi:hypothetical protein